MRAWARYLALAILVAAAPTAAALAANGAEDVLLDKANYWRLKDRPDLAAEALNQLLEINPNQPDALYQYGMLQVQQNKPAEAQRYLAKLQQVAPGNPHIGDLQNAIRAGQIGTNDLGEARRLAQAGQLTEAVQKYQQIFKGPPPPSFGVEYYMTLGGTPQGWDEARQGLERLAQGSPNDAQVKLALGQLYTYREPTRMEGIALLSQLSKNPVVGGEATKAWKQALTWLGGNPQSKTAYQQYLGQYPSDPDIQQLLADLAKTPAAGPGNEAQSKAYADLKRGNLAAAERQFAADLRDNPNDAAALAGLGLVRLRQQRFAEARELLARAKRADPEQSKDIDPAYGSAQFWSRVNEAKALAARKNYAAASAILNGLLRSSRSADNWGAEMVLADVEAKQGHNAAAEAAYRRVLRARPGNVDALAGLASVLKAQGKTAEADAIVNRLPPSQRARFAGGGPGGNRGEKLRQEAKEADADGKKTVAAAKFQEAIAADPKNPWIRLDYARFLAGQNQMGQAASVVDPAASGGSPTSYLAAAMYQMYQNRWGDALALIDRVPPAERTTDLNNFRDRVLVQGTIDQAKQRAKAGDRAGARDMIVRVYNDPKVVWDIKGQLVYALNDMGEKETALQITRAAAARGGPGSTRALIDETGLLVSTSREDEAAEIVAQIRARGPLSVDEREALMPTVVYLATVRADKLRERGDYAAAYDEISPLLAEKPDDAKLLLCLGRIYGSAGRSKEAQENFEKAYQLDSGSPDVLRGVIEGLIMIRAFAQADDYLDKAMQGDPQNPRFFYLRAKIAQGKGDNATAVRDLKTARSLLAQQRGETVPGTVTTTEPAPSPAGAPASAVPAPAAPASPPNPNPNPFRNSEAAPAPARRVGFSLIGSAVADEALPPGQFIVLAANQQNLPARLPLAPPTLIAQSADSADLVIPPAQPRRITAQGQPADATAPPIPTTPASTTEAAPTAPADTTTSDAPAGPSSVDNAMSALFTGKVDFPQPVIAELQPPPPVGGYQVPIVTIPSAAVPPTGDSLDLDIERSLAMIQAESNPMLTAGVGLRMRDGASGLSRLTEVGIPVGFSFSPWYTGTAKMWVTPVYLDAGTMSSDGLANFGANAAAIAGGLTVDRPGQQTAAGVSLMAGYAYGPISGTFGTSPIGFPVTNLLGSLAYSPKIWEDASIRIEGMRQPVVDTLLSYAGQRANLAQANAVTANNFGNNNTWGGVTKNGFRGQVYYDNRNYGAYVGGGWALLVGQQVPENDETEAYLGAYFRPWKWDDNTVRVGVALAYLGYTKNLSGFTFGQGGYFSPRNYEALTFPIELTGHSGNWSYLAAAAVGVQHFNQAGGPFYPNNPSAQRALEILNPTGTNSFGGMTSTGPAFNVHGQIEYAVSNTLTLGAAGSFDNGRDYNEGIAKLYLRKTFDVTSPMPAAVPASRLGFREPASSSM